MLRLVIAGLIMLTLVPAALVLDDNDSLGQFLWGMGVMFGISFALPHYFYRGEPLLPDRRKRR